MKTLKEHNEERMRDFLKNCDRYLATGIACPKCGRELYADIMNRILIISPPKQIVRCECGYHGRAII